MNLDNSVAIITGGASGLGEATVRKFHLKGCHVCIFDSDSNKGSLLANELGKNAVFFPVDVRDPSNVEEAITEVIRRFKKITINVNCAGIAIAEKTLGKEGIHSLDNFKKVVEVNLIGTFNVVCLCAKQMVHNSLDVNSEKGVIINTASVAGIEGQKGQVAYAASKGGVASMTLPIARDLAKRGVRVMTVAPGVFETPLLASAPDEVKEPLIAITQFPKRLGNPDEFGEEVAHIVRCSYLNGEVIRLDAGIRMRYVCLAKPKMGVAI